MSALTITMTPATITHGEVDMTEDGSSLAWLQDKVDGPVQALVLGHGALHRVMWINEDGKGLNLPLNTAATLLARSLEAISPTDWIAGTAVITGATAAGDTVGLALFQLDITYVQLTEALKKAPATS